MELDYGKAFKEHRIANNLSQPQLSKATNIPQSTISATENNINLPNIDICVRLANFYGITVDELIGRDFIPNSK